MTLGELIAKRRKYLRMTQSALAEEIHVSKSKFTLVLLLDGNVYRIFKVGIGRDNRTPVGIFEIKDESDIQQNRKH